MEITFNLIPLWKYLILKKKIQPLNYNIIFFEGKYLLENISPYTLKNYLEFCNTMNVFFKVLA